jgi:hypothetical protein
MRGFAAGKTTYEITNSLSPFFQSAEPLSLHDFLSIVPDAFCHQCQEPLIEIDRYGERLIGCVVCNRWGWPGDKNLIMELSDEDIAALKGG